MAAAKIDSLRRAANATVEHLTSLTAEVNISGSREVAARKDALADAHAVHMLAMALAGTAIAAIRAFEEPRPPTQHYHTHQAPRLPIGPTMLGSVTVDESAGAPMSRRPA